MEIWSRYQKFLIPVFVLVAAVLVFAALKATKPQTPLTEVEERFWPVAHQSVVLSDVRPWLRSFGEVRAGREAELRPQVSGIVVSVHNDFADGASVRTGEVLVSIDDFDYRAGLNEQKADLNEAEAKLAELNAVLLGEESLLPGDNKQKDLAISEVGRQQQLLKSSAGRRKTYDDALSALNDRKQSILMREQAIAKLRTQVIQAQSAVDRAHIAVEKAMRDMEDTQLKAPFDGFLSDTAVAAGKQVSTSDRLAQLISLERLEIRFHLSEADFTRLTKSGDLIGRVIKVMVGQASQKSEFEAKVVRIDARVDAATGGRKIFATLSGLTLDTNLRPGVFVEVLVPDKLYQNVVTVPAQTVHDDQYVYVIAEGRLKKRDVTIGVKEGDQVLITSGLQVGDEICLTRFPEMGEGIKVVMR
jgi:membrane fusion protein, multidrug efflux system